MDDVQKNGLNMQDAEQLLDESSATVVLSQVSNKFKVNQRKYWHSCEALNQLKIFNQLDSRISEEKVQAKAAIESFINRTTSSKKATKVLTKYYFKILQETF